MSEDLLKQAGGAAPAVEAAVDASTTKTYSALEIKLWFNPSSTGKSMVLVDGNNLFMVNLATFNDVLAGNLTKVHFHKNAEPMPKRPQDPADSPEMYSWRPNAVDEIKALQHEREARDVNAEANLAHAKINLKKVSKILLAEA